MLFESSGSNFFECPFDKRFVISKTKLINWWELCLKDELNEEGYPKVIAFIAEGDEGKLKNASNLGWKISEEFRNQGIMSKLLNLYLEEISPKTDGFAVVILKSNIPSFRLAIKLGFSIYDEDEDKFYLKK